MTHWETLQLAPTTNKRQVKQAYAALLKLNKPDENPTGFAALHAAYKTCLHEIDWRAAQGHEQEPHAEEPAQASGTQTLAEPIEPATNIVPDATDDTATAALEPAYIEGAPKSSEAPIQQPAPDTAEDKRIAYLRESWQWLAQQTDEALAATVKSASIEHWQFLDGHDALYDLEFKNDFSDYLFERLKNFFNQYRSKLEQRDDLLAHLNQYFRWTDDHLRLEAIFGDEASTRLLNQCSQAEAPKPKGLQWTTPKHHPGPMVFAGYYGRLFSTLVDMLVLLFFCTAFTGDDTVLGVMYAIAVYAGFVPLLEASPLQGTPAKVLFGLKVTSRKGKRLNLLHAYWRHLLFLLSLAGFKITVWINLFGWDGRLLHDKLSLSLVIRRT